VDRGAPIAVTREGEPDAPVALGGIVAARRERELVEERLLRAGEYAIGPRPDLIGRRFSGPAVSGPRATVDAPRGFAAIREDAVELPAFVSGDVRGLPDDAPLALAVNGRVVATTRVFPHGDEGQYVALVPPDSLRAGANDVAVLAIEGDRLRKIGGNRSITRP
jgi:hypothetical protein